MIFGAIRDVIIFTNKGWFSIVWNTNKFGIGPTLLLTAYVEIGFQLTCSAFANGDSHLLSNSSRAQCTHLFVLKAS